MNKIGLAVSCVVCGVLGEGNAYALDALNWQGITFQPGLEIGAAYVNNRNQGFGASSSYYGERAP